jgi:hypothetical protein
MKEFKNCRPQLEGVQELQGENYFSKNKNKIFFSSIKRKNSCHLVTPLSHKVFSEDLSYKNCKTDVNMSISTNATTPTGRKFFNFRSENLLGIQEHHWENNFAFNFYKIYKRDSQESLKGIINFFHILLN